MTGKTRLRGKPASVYVMRSGAVVKVGRSTDVHRRVRDVSRRIPEPAVLIGATEPSRQAPAIEATAHKLLARHRRNGEWFRCSARAAWDAVQDSVYRHKCYGCSPAPIRKHSPVTSPSSPALFARVSVRVPREMLRRVDAIANERLDRPDRAQVIRELIAQAIVARDVNQMREKT